jgi:hypothetical protein
MVDALQTISHDNHVHHMKTWKDGRKNYSLTS